MSNFAQQPYASWTLDTQTMRWQAPEPYPTDGAVYLWDEDLGAWEPIVVESLNSVVASPPVEQAFTTAGTTLSYIDTYTLAEPSITIDLQENQ